MPLLRNLPDIQQIHISGPIREEDLPLIKTGLKAAAIAEVHFELDKKSAEYFLKALPEILENATITTITLRNYEKESEITLCKSERGKRM